MKHSMLLFFDPKRYEQTILPTDVSGTVGSRKNFSTVFDSITPVASSKHRAGLFTGVVLM
jgi:hypothetical protein